MALQHRRELHSREITESIISMCGCRFQSSFQQLMCRNLEGTSGLCAPHMIIKLLMEVKTTRVEPVCASYSEPSKDFLIFWIN